MAKTKTEYFKTSVDGMSIQACVTIPTSVLAIYSSILCKKGILLRCEPTGIFGKHGSFDTNTHGRLLTGYQRSKVLSIFTVFGDYIRAGARYDPAGSGSATRWVKTLNAALNAPNKPTTSTTMSTGSYKYRHFINLYI